MDAKCRARARANACESSSVAAPASSRHSFILAMAERDREVARALNSLALESGFNATSDHALTQFIADYFDGEESDGKPLTHTKSVVTVLSTDEDEENSCVLHGNYY